MLRNCSHGMSRITPRSSVKRCYEFDEEALRPYFELDHA